MANKKVTLIVLLVIIVIGINMTLFTVDETRQVIITQFGKYIKTVDKAGLHLKIPLMQTVHYFDKRRLEYDAAPAEILTRDKKTLVVDNYARFIIVDPLKVYQTVRDEIGAQARLDDIIYSELREELARHDFSEIIDLRREAIMDTVAKRSAEKAVQYGIRIIDVRIKRADLAEEVKASVYGRMRAERERIAKKYRSEGNEEAMKIRAETDKQKVFILAEAYRRAQRIKGEGDARAIKIYARAFQKDAEFYSFLRALEAYKKFIREGTIVVLESNSELFRYLGSPKK